MIVSTELNQIKSLAQYLMCREHSGNCLQNHNQKVDTWNLCSLIPFPYLLDEEVSRGAAEAGVWSRRRQGAGLSFASAAGELWARHLPSEGSACGHRCVN